MTSRPALIPARLPNKRPKPYIQPAKRGAKAMTVGLGFLVSDAVILASDRQMTQSEWNKFPETKMFHDHDSERIIAMVAGDELGLAKEIWWELIKHPITDYESLKAALTEVLDSKGRLNIDLPLQLLCGIATKTDTYLLEFRGRAIYPVMDEFGLICSGDSSLIHYLTRNINLVMESPDYGVTVATYLLKRAEEFIATCHGPMDMIVLKPGPKSDRILNEQIEEIDKRLKDKHFNLFYDLFSLSPPFSI